VAQGAHTVAQRHVTSQNLSVCGRATVVRSAGALALKLGAYSTIIRERVWSVGGWVCGERVCSCSDESDDSATKCGERVEGESVWQWKGRMVKAKIYIPNLIVFWTNGGITFRELQGVCQL
jgi:hypothetical protein